MGVLRVVVLLTMGVVALEQLLFAQEGDGGIRAWTLLREQGLTGSLRVDYFRSSKLLDDETDFTGGTAQFKLLPVFNEMLTGKVEARLTDPAIGKGAETSGSLLEGFVSLHFDKGDLRIGKQIVAWGRADGINPTDNLTPHDYVVLLPFEEDQRFGTMALKGDGYLSNDYTLTLFISPFFEPSKIPLIAPAGTILIENKPTSNFSDTEVAVKLNKSGGAFDGSISFFHGFDLLPDARASLTPMGPVIELRHTIIDVIGIDMARNFGKFGFRAEGAYFITEDHNGLDPTIKNPFLFYVLGVDRTFLENLNINIQFVGRYIRYYQDPEAINDPFLRSLAVQNAIVNGQQDQTSYGLTSRIGDKWFNDTLEAELLMFINFNRTNSYFRPLVTYAFTDHVKGTVGGEVYQGPDDSFFGRLKKNESVFTEIRYSF